jgi:GntR family carbon starvation induced transcriptional regulator
MANTLATFCVAKIQELIFSGQLRPGERIKGEYLKNYLNVGLSPIREALSRLISTNLVECIDNIGFRVALITKDKVYDTYKSYAKIESLLFCESIESGNETWESAIIAALYHLSKVESVKKAEYKIWNVYNEGFHNALISGCSLNTLNNIRKSLVLNKDWYHNLAYHNLPEELIMVNHSEHSKIAELAIARRADAACAMLYKHTMHSLEPLLLKLKQCGYIDNECEISQSNRSE